MTNGKLFCWICSIFRQTSKNLIKRREGTYAPKILRQSRQCPTELAEQNPWKVLFYFFRDCKQALPIVRQAIYKDLVMLEYIIQYIRARQLWLVFAPVWKLRRRKWRKSVRLLPNIWFLPFMNIGNGWRCSILQLSILSGVIWRLIYLLLLSGSCKFRKLTLRNWNSKRNVLWQIVVRWINSSLKFDYQRRSYASRAFLPSSSWMWFQTPGGSVYNTSQWILIQPKIMKLHLI